MPEMNGIELAKKVLDHRMVPILFHTGSWSKNALYELLFQNITSEFPISIVNKSYFFQNPQEYEARLAHKIEEVQQKFIATTYPFNTSSLDKIISKISQKDNLIEYLKTIYDELFTQAHQAVSALAPDVIPSAIKQRILDQKLDLTPISTEQFYHNLRYPLSCMYSLLIPYARNNSCTLIINLLEKMETIKQYVQSEQTKFCPTSLDIIDHAAILKKQVRRALPNHAHSEKLRCREIVLTSQKTEYIVVSPLEQSADYLAKVRSVFPESMALIIRSMSTLEDNTLPFAGYFESIKITSNSQIEDAVNLIRTTYSKDLEQFCFIRGFELPTAKNMTLLIEPFHQTEYCGAVLEHPTQENILLIEYHPYTNSEQKEFCVYDTKKETVECSQTTLENIPQIAKALSAKLIEVKKMTNADSQKSYQMEFGFSLTTKLTHYDFQLRVFQQKKSAPNFTIDSPIACRTIFGATTAEGIEMVIATTTDPVELDLISKKAASENIPLAYILRDNSASNIPFCVENVDLLITGKDLAIQSHNYFNALSQAPHAVIMTQAQITQLSFEQGDRIRYTSNGFSAQIKKNNASELLKYHIRNILNTPTSI